MTAAASDGPLEVPSVADRVYAAPRTDIAEGQLGPRGHLKRAMALLFSDDL